MDILYLFSNIYITVYNLLFYFFGDFNFFKKENENCENCEKFSFGIYDDADDEVSGIYDDADDEVSGIYDAADDEVSGIYDAADDEVSGIYDAADDEVSNIENDEDDEVSNIENDEDDEVSNIENDEDDEVGDDDFGGFKQAVNNNIMEESERTTHNSSNMSFASSVLDEMIPLLEKNVDFSNCENEDSEWTCNICGNRNTVYNMNCLNCMSNSLNSKLLKLVSIQDKVENDWEII